MARSALIEQASRVFDVLLFRLQKYRKRKVIAVIAMAPLDRPAIGVLVPTAIVAAPFSSNSFAIVLSILFVVSLILFTNALAFKFHIFASFRRLAPPAATTASNYSLQPVRLPRFSCIVPFRVGATEAIFDRTLAHWTQAASPRGGPDLM